MTASGFQRLEEARHAGEKSTIDWLSAFFHDTLLVRMEDEAGQDSHGP